MIVEEGKYYLYRHVRLDNNKPFYIGIGRRSKRYSSEDYARAFDKLHRSKWWKTIVNKTDYVVEILLESNDDNFIKTKEKEFIELYGRKDCKTGCLVNLTEGGEGNEKSKLSKQKFKQTFKDKEWRKIIQYDLDGNFVKEYNGYSDVVEKTGYDKIVLRKALTGKFKQCYGFIWFYKDLFSLVELFDKINNKNRKYISVIQILKDGTEKEWKSIAEAANSLNIDRGSITKVCNGQRKTCKNSFWKFKNINHACTR